MARVLLVDDEEPIRRAIRLWLGRKGHVVLEAGTLEEARQLIATQMLDGIFIDFHLGEQSGHDLFTWVDALDPALADRVAFVTGDLFGAGALNGRKVFTKPFELRDLEAQAVAWERSRARSAGAPRARGDQDSRETGEDGVASRR